MPSEAGTAEAAGAPRPVIARRPLNMPTADQIRRNLAAVFRDQIVGAAKAGKDESLDYWLARYVDLLGGGTPAGREARRTRREARVKADRSDGLPPGS